MTGRIRIKIQSRISIKVIVKYRNFPGLKRKRITVSKMPNTRLTSIEFKETVQYDFLPFVTNIVFRFPGLKKSWQVCAIRLNASFFPGV
jgi:hypothetical protein